MDGATTERAQGVCPTDWHIPSDCEWMYLENSLGMTTADQQLTGFRDSGTVGSKLKSSTFGGTNSSGFTALISGFRYTNGAFYNRNAYGFWWTSSIASASLPHVRRMDTSQAGIGRDGNTKDQAYSIRCLKD